MRTYRIVSSAGVDMGTCEGATPEEALDVMARGAGYASQEEASLVAGPFTGTVTEEITLRPTDTPGQRVPL